VLVFRNKLKVFDEMPKWENVAFLCIFFANMFNFIVYICYNDYKFAFLIFLASLISLDIMI